MTEASVDRDKVNKNEVRTMERTKSKADGSNYS